MSPRITGEAYLRAWDHGYAAGRADGLYWGAAGVLLLETVGGLVGLAFWWLR